MEALCDDLGIPADEETVPEAYEMLLEERRRRVNAGEVKLFDFEDVKRELRSGMPVGATWEFSTGFGQTPAILENLSEPEKVELLQALCDEAQDRQDGIPSSTSLRELLEERVRRVESGEAKLQTIEETMAAVRKQVGL